MLSTNTPQLSTTPYKTLSDSSDETIISIITPMDLQISSTTQYIHMYILHTFIVYLIPSISLIILLCNTYDTTYDNIKLTVIIIFTLLLCTTIVVSFKIYRMYTDTMCMLYNNKCISRRRSLVNEVWS
jgi:hypothetical protein